MWRALCVVSVLASVIGGHGQGLVRFNTRLFSEGVHAPFFRESSCPYFRDLLDGDHGWVGQLYYGGEDGWGWPSHAAGVPVPFGKGRFAGFLDGGAVAIPAHPPGTLVWVNVTAWNLADGETAEASMASAIDSWYNDGDYRGLTSSIRVPVRLGDEGGLGTPLYGLTDAVIMVWYDDRFFLFSEPTDARLAMGDSFELKVHARRVRRCQWQKDEVDIPGATDMRLLLSNVSQADAGSYRALLSYSCPVPGGVWATRPALIEVVDPGVSIARYAGLTIHGEVGGVYRIDHRTNVEDPQWVPLFTLTLSQSPQVWIDYDTPHHPRRVYRVVRVEE